MIVLFQTITRRKENVRGATAVEFAFVLPMFVLFMFGIFDFGRYFYVQHTVQYATREGARLAMVGGTLADEEGNQLSRAASIKKKIQESAVLHDPGMLQISVFPIDPDKPDETTGSENTLDAGQPGQYMRVHTRYPYTFIVPFIDAFSGKEYSIEASATYRNELF